MEDVKDDEVEKVDCENISEEKISSSSPTIEDINGSVKSPAVSDDRNYSEECQMELESGYRIISEVIKQNKTTCWPFMEAVDADGLGLWDYHIKIKEPMWLNKIVENFVENKYSCFADFAKDFRIMVENCYRYNTTEHPISKKAKRLEMLFEGKLALLKKSVRENATIAKTSNGRFATLSDEANSTMRSGRVSIPANGANREADGETQGRLVYDFVRCEEATLAEDERQASYRERKQQQTLYQQIAAAFVSSLESREEAKIIKTCHYIPEIGLFLHLNESTLRLPPLAMYNLEMSLIIPSDSRYLAKIMTSFLCTYYERSLINQRNPMMFKTWEHRLKQRLEKWYDTVIKYNSYYYASEKLLIGMEFFHTMNWKNPFYTEDGQERSFLDFTYDEKAAIIKAVCDNMTTFQSVQNNIASLPCEQSRVMSLGFDVAGNEYTYFPQFCGDDVRVYRHRQHGDLPVYDAPDSEITIALRKNKNKAGTIPDKVSDDHYNATNSTSNGVDVTLDVTLDLDKKEQPISLVSVPCDSERLTGSSLQNSDHMPPSKENEDIKVTTPPSENTSPTSEESDLPTADREVKTFPSRSSIVSDGVDKFPPTSQVSKLENNSSQGSIGEPDSTSSKNDKDSAFKNAVNDNKRDKDEIKNASMKYSSNNLSNDSCTKNSINNEMETGTMSSPLSATMSASDDNYEPTSGQKTSKSSLRKKMHKKKIEESANSPLRRSSRKRNAVNYTSMLVHPEPDSSALSEASSTECLTPKKKPKRAKKPKNIKKTAMIIQVEEPEEEYGSVDFEMVCDGLDSLRKLIATVEQEHKDAIRDKKPKVVINNVASLLERLEWLLGELRSYETHLEKARFDAKIQLKREHDEILRAATTGTAIHSSCPDADPWEDEILSKNTMMQGENLTTYHTPPASIYLEESDEESDREIRRSKRRPKRYESDEDFVLDSDENSPSYQTSTMFSYDEFDEGRLQLVPAALEELKVRLQKQAQALHKMMGCGRVTRQNEFKEASQLLSNERRTRQRSKKENKVFKQVLLLALKDKEMVGPSLVPLLRTDQAEIGEIVELVLEQEVIAREQRRLEREEEKKRNRDYKQVMQQKKKAAQAAQRAANKLVAKYKQERHELKPEPKKAESSTSKSPAPNMFSPPKKTQSLPKIQTSNKVNHVLTSEKTENVMIRLQNGKICQALKFSDGRVVPIVRMGNSTKASTFENITHAAAKKPEYKPQVFHPHISLTSHRNTVAPILKRQAVQNAQTFSNPTGCTGQSPSAGTQPVSTPGASPAAKCASKLLVDSYQAEVPSKIVSSQFAGLPLPSQPAKVMQMQQPQQQRLSTASNKNVLSQAGVSQRLTLPSGRVINLLVKNSATTVDKQTPTQSLGKMFVDNINTNLDSIPSAATPLQSPTPSMILTRPMQNPLPSAAPSNVHVEPSQAVNSVTKVSKPLGIVSPMQVRQPINANNAEVTLQNAAKAQFSAPQTLVRYTVPQQQQQVNYASPVIAQASGSNYQDNQRAVGAPEQHPQAQYSTSQQGYLGMQNVAYVTQPVYHHQQQQSQPVQLVQTLVAGSVPIVQPVQFVQTVPIQVQTPVMFVAPGQTPLQLSGVDSTQQYVLTSSVATGTQARTITTQSPQQTGMNTFTQEN